MSDRDKAAFLLVSSKEFGRVHTCADCEDLYVVLKEVDRATIEYWIERGADLRTFKYCRSCASSYGGEPLRGSTSGSGKEGGVVDPSGDRKLAAWLLSVSECGEVYTCSKCGDLYAFTEVIAQEEIARKKSQGRGLGSLGQCGPCANSSNRRRGFAPRAHFRGPNPWPPNTRKK